MTTAIRWYIVMILLGWIMAIAPHGDARLDFLKSLQGWLIRDLERRRATN